MGIVIKAIKFNHDPNSTNHDAVNIRKNKTQFINVPEWVQGISTNAEDSLAAYAIKETEGNIITIQARFQADENIQQAEIRAIDPTVTPSGCIGWIIKIFLSIFGNVLGEVKERSVTFSANGDSGFVSFDLRNPQLSDAGVGIHYTAWKWQYRIGRGSWTDMDTTRHKIYVILETPKDPWKQGPYNATNDQLPWTDVMNYSCIWAIGEKNRDAAAGKVTERVNALGPSVIEYDCPGGGSHAYAIPLVWYPTQFNCTEFLERLTGGPGLGKYVNCTDCATIVSTFANIVGCDLWQSRMAENPITESSIGFDCNEVVAIGHTTWNTPCGWPGFTYHEVAWKGACDVNDELFDACLKVDGDNNPTGGSPHTPLLPVKMKFGNIGDMLYRDRLAAPLGRANCKPQPITRVRRSIL
jgi:hypothetical protein